MSKFSDNLPIVYINRDEDVDRRAYMESQFESLGITNAVRFSAFTDELIKADPGFRISIEEVREKVLKAFVSHLLALKSLNFKDSPYALVLEDDVVLSTSNNWPFTLEEFCEALPNGWDAVQLYLNPKFRSDNADLTLRPYRESHISTVAYLITKERAEAAVSEWFRVGVPDVLKAQSRGEGFLTDHLVYTDKSYAVNLFSTKDFVSTIVKKIPDRFHESSRRVVSLWENSPVSLEKIIKDSYTKTPTP